MNRRRLLQTGGLTVSLGAVLAACGGDDDTESAPGRVGYAPPATPLPTVEKTDAVWLRTASSIEYTVLDVYARTTEMGALDATAQALIDRFVEDHTEHAELLAGLTVEAGGEPYECANAWYIDRTVDPIFTQITGSDALKHRAERRSGPRPAHRLQRLRVVVRGDVPADVRGAHRA